MVPPSCSIARLSSSASPSLQTRRQRIRRLATTGAHPTSTLHRNRTLLAAVLAYAVVATTAFAPLLHHRSPTRVLHVTNSDLGSSWSRAETDTSARRVGVRNRVKAVLNRARSRRAPNVVAEAATLGGLYPHADLVQPTAGATEEAVRSVQGPMRNGTDVDLIIAAAESTNGESTDDVATATKKSRLQVDAVLSSGVVEPLPFALPTLTPMQRQLLEAGERVQEQSRMGRDGSGFVVLDVEAPDFCVWECLLDFDRYPELIGTVRSMQMFTNTHLKQSYVAERPVESHKLLYGRASITRAKFVLSKFKLNIAAVHKYTPHPDGHFMEFSLDKANRNIVLKHAKGIWYTEKEPDGRKGVTRVWLLCELSVSSVLPKFVVDYTAERAMPRATKWLKPTVLDKKQEMQALITSAAEKEKEDPTNGESL